MKKIEVLTSEQEALFSIYRDKWLSIGLATEDYHLSDEELRSLVDGVYRIVGLEPPKDIVRVKSPLQLQQEATKRTGRTGWHDVLYGNQEAGLLAFYEYFMEVCGLDLASVRPLIELSKRVGWFVTLDRTCIVSERPLFTLRNERGALHAEGGPALAYSDGYAVYALNGVRFPKALAEKFIVPKANTLNSIDVLNITNVEQRGEVIKRIGVKAFLKYLNPKTLDTAGDYQLLQVQVGPHRRVYLQMKNPSIEETHIEAVHPDCQTVANALAYRNFGSPSDSWVPPLVLT